MDLAPSAPSLYPDLNAFSTDAYLPQDYHMTIGRNYDLSLLAKQWAQQSEMQPDDEEDDDK